MKRIAVTLILVLACAVAAHAQYSNRDYFSRSGSRIAANGVVLTEAEKIDVLMHYTDRNLYGPWQQYSSGRALGIGLTIGGGAATVLGTAFSLFGGMASLAGATIGATIGAIGGSDSAQQGAQSGSKAGNPYVVIGTVTSLLGLGAIGAGIPLLVINNRRMNDIVMGLNSYSSTPAVQLSMGPAPSGFGLTLTF